MEIIHLQDEKLEDLKKEGNVLVDFYADWCGPCKMLGGVLESLSEERADLKIVKINVDQHQDIAGEYGVMSIPAVFLFKDGQETNRFIGYKTLEEIEEMINE